MKRAPVAQQNVTHFDDGRALDKVALALVGTLNWQPQYGLKHAPHMW